MTVTKREVNNFEFQNSDLQLNLAPTERASKMAAISVVRHL